MTINSIKAQDSFQKTALYNILTQSKNILNREIYTNRDDRNNQTSEKYKPSMYLLTLDNLIY